MVYSLFLSSFCCSPFGWCHQMAWLFFMGRSGQNVPIRINREHEWTVNEHVLRYCIVLVDLIIWISGSRPKIIQNCFTWRFASGALAFDWLFGCSTKRCAGDATNNQTWKVHVYMCCDHIWDDLAWLHMGRLTKPPHIALCSFLINWGTIPQPLVQTLLCPVLLLFLREHDFVSTVAMNFLPIIQGAVAYGVAIPAQWPQHVVGMLRWTLCAMADGC